MAVAATLIGQEVKARDYVTMCGNAISRQTNALLWRLRRVMVMGQSEDEEPLRPREYVIELGAPPRALCNPL